jgi:ABC-2 type transport system permease protein
MSQPANHAVVSESLLRYRPWRGEFRPPINASWALARTSFRLILRKKAFWALFALAAMIFFFFFYGQYLIVWVSMQAGQQSVSFSGIPIRLDGLSKFLDGLNLNGSAHTFGNLIWFEGYIVTIVLAFAGSILVGNDFHHGSLPYYFSKPIGQRHYILGKCLAIGFLIQLLTTLPAMILFIQAGLLYDWKSYYFDHVRQFVGILAYGIMLTAVMGMLLIAVSVSVRRTVPLVMVWMGLFVLMPLIGRWLVEGPQLTPLWRLIDLWNDLYLVGLWLLDADFKSVKTDRNPSVLEAAVVLTVVVVCCGLYLQKRIRAVDVTT